MTKIRFIDFKKSVNYEWDKHLGNYVCFPGLGIFIHNTSMQTIDDHVLIGENVTIGPYCLIGMEAEIIGNQRKDYSVEICEETTITGCVTIDAGVNNITRIGKNNFLMKHTHIGHDVITGSNCTFSPGAKIGGHAVLEDNVTVGMNACVHQKIYIPKGVMIGMGAMMVKKEYVPYRKYVMNGKDIGFNQVAFDKYEQETQ